MPSGWYGFICAICFEGLTPEECAVDAEGQRWDVHKGECARQSGLAEAGDACMHRRVTPTPQGWLRCDDCGRTFRVRGNS